MRKRYAPFLFCLATGLAANAQLTLTVADNVPVVGDTFLYNTAPYGATSAGGEDQLFDYSGLTATGTTTWTWIAPDEYSNVGAFPTATIAAASATDTLFFEVTSAGLERVGERQTIIVYDVEVPLSDASLNLKLPLAFGDSWNDNIAATFDAGTYPSTRNGTINGSADATGTLLLPGGSSTEVVRVRTVTQEVNTIETDLFPVTVTHKRTEYAYYANFLKTPLLRVYTDSLTSSIGVNQNVNSTEWLDASDVAVLEAAGGPSGFSVFPNPTADAVTVRFASDPANGAFLEVLDALGRPVLTQNLTAAGLVGSAHVLSLAGQAPGCYLVRLRDAQGIRAARRVIKN